MTTFNDLNGVPSTANKFLLTQVLRHEWGFKGFVVTDYTSINCNSWRTASRWMNTMPGGWH